MNSKKLKKKKKEPVLRCGYKGLCRERVELIHSHCFHLCWVTLAQKSSCSALTIGPSWPMDSAWVQGPFWENFQAGCFWKLERIFPGTQSVRWIRISLLKMSHQFWNVVWPSLTVAKYVCMHANSLQSCSILCDTMDCSPPDSSVHRILQAGILEWVAMPSSRGSSRPRDWTCVSYVSALAA